MQDNRTIYEDCDFITWILYKNAPLIRHYRQLSPTSVYVCFLVLLSMYMLGHGDECIVWRKWTRVCRSCETDAFRRPAARPFVQDAQSAVRLPVSPSRRSRDRLSGSRKALWASRTNRLAAGRRPALRSRSRSKHTRGQLLHTMHSPPCHNVLSSCHAHAPPLLPSWAEVPHGSRLAWVPARGVAKWHSVDRRYTWFRSSV